MILRISNKRKSSEGVYATVEQWTQQRLGMGPLEQKRELIFVYDNGVKIIVQFEDKGEVIDLIKKLERIQDNITGGK